MIAKEKYKPGHGNAAARADTAAVRRISAVALDVSEADTHLDGRSDVGTEEDNRSSRILQLIDAKYDTCEHKPADLTMTTELSESTDNNNGSHQRYTTAKEQSHETHSNSEYNADSVAVDESDNSEGQYVCTVCQKSFTTKYYLRAHMNENRHFQCTLCDKTFSAERTLRVHVKRHSAGTELYQCDVCPKVYTHSANLFLHRKVHDGSQDHQCDICDALFSRKADLQRHRMIHTGDFNFNCAECGHGFIHKGDYNRHMMGHTGQGGHICPYCDKVLVRKVEMKLHLSTHEESGVDFRLKCSDCDAGFTSVYQYKRHKMACTHVQSELTTTNAKVGVTCNVCNKVLNSVSNLNKHIGTVHDNSEQKAFSCQHCTKYFRLKTSLQEHVKYVHLKVGNFLCSLCDKRFTKGRYLAKHEESEHGQEIKQEQVLKEDCETL